VKFSQCKLISGDVLYGEITVFLIRFSQGKVLSFTKI
jgi:hypothetical protein